MNEAPIIRNCFLLHNKEFLVPVTMFIVPSYHSTAPPPSVDSVPSRFEYETMQVFSLYEKLYITSFTKRNKYFYPYRLVISEIHVYVVK